MSVLREKWEVEDIRKVIENLDRKTGMNGASHPISVVSFIDKEKKILGTYQPGIFKCFCFSKYYFDDTNFPDRAVIDVIRHEYCHYLVDELNLSELYENDDSHGVAWKSACAFMNTDDTGTFSRYRFWRISEKQLQKYIEAEDIPEIDIIEKLDLWGLDVVSARHSKTLEKRLVKKYGRARVFKVNDEVIHKKKGHGVVLDVRPVENKQLLYVSFDSGEKTFVQNRQVYKIVNGMVLKPKAG